MPLCLACGYEYEPHLRTCPECGEPLVAADDPRAVRLTTPVDPTLSRQKLVRVFRGPDELSVRGVHSALVAEGLAAVVRSLQISAFDDIFRDTEGVWGEVLVLEQDAERAAEIIDVMETGRIATEDLPEAPDSSEPPARE